ncbi:MAG: asparagine synthase (glutamine-hydrolyzing) [Gemmatimonadetes bacterium]|nr:asparagine synthase (glutamine-hydrolyzing) [Gemmatimonadota bacterium]
MCGIAGVVYRDGRRPKRERLVRMADRIVHRGPDEDGYLERPGCGLAFRRLRIIDLHTGSQPQSNEDGTVHVVFNGEIYNHQELRRDLISRGHRFQTESDTEVLVHLYEERGEDLVHALNGMFGFAVWDERRRRLVLGRDRVGIKPLVWAETPDGMAFGSETGSLLECPGVDDEIDPTAVHHYLSWGNVPAPLTMRRGIRRLPPGHIMVWEDGRKDIRPYWHPLDSNATVPATYEEGREQLRHLLEDSVRLRMVADVPLGAFLSGGVDSTAIVGLMSKRSPDVHTFSIGFSDDPVFDETPYAREAARFHGSRHQECQLGAEDLREAIPGILDSVSEPFGSASLLPTFVVSRETRKQMTVALSGDGADELFAGYNKYLGEVYRGWYGRIPGPLRRGVVDPAIRALPASRSSRAGEIGRKARRFLDGVSGEAAERHEALMRFAPPWEINGLLGEDPGAHPGLDIVQDLHADFDARGSDDTLNRTLFTDLRLALPTDMLLKVDTASMLNSLEVRVPFLDHRVVELAMRMPGCWKMRGTQRKHILKDAVRDLLPPGIQKRPKAGFDVPVGEWFKTSMRDLFWDTVRTDGAVPLDLPRLERWYDEHRAGRADHSKILWAAFTLRWWENRESVRSAETRDLTRTLEVV